MGVDTGLETCVILTDAEIIQAMCAVQATSRDPSALGGGDSDASKGEMPPPSATDIASALDTTACYFSCQENADVTLEPVCKLQAMFVEFRQKKCVQAGITDYFLS